MIFDGIKFHNVSEIREDGALSRFPKEVLAQLDIDMGRATAMLCSGVELRFRMIGDQVTLHLRMRDTTEGLPASIFFGCFQGGWDTSVKYLGPESVSITIRRPTGMARLIQLCEERKQPFRPELVRVVLPYGGVCYEGHEGELEPPHAGDEPERTLLTYGSSITHGSLALGTPHTYAFRLAARLGMDCLNMGIAGSCRLEQPLLKWMLARRDWHEAMVEIGINMLGDFDEKSFAERVCQAIDLLAADDRPIHVTSILRTACEGEKEVGFRRIVREAAQGRVDFIDGDALLSDPAMIAADLVHPSMEGHQTITDRWARHIQEVRHV